MGQHRTGYKKYLNGKYGYVSSFEIIKLNDSDIILIENFSCNTKEELHARERYHFDLNKAICVNKNIPTRTKKEYRIDNADTIKQQRNQYRIDNADTIKQQRNQYRIDNAEKIKQYRIDNAETIKQYQKQYYINKKQQS
jgi:hypothetical protein